jgi:protease IV
MATSRSTRLLLWIVAVGVLISMALVVAGVIYWKADSNLLAGDTPHHLFARIGGELHDAPGNATISFDATDLPPLVTETAQAIRDAAKDDAIDELWLEIRPIEGGWGEVEELRSAVWAFRQADKPCIAWSDTLTTKEYYLASACDRIELAPGGVALVNGLSLTTAYYAGTFEKLGVHADFEHVGNFKSAVEPLQRTGPSEAASEATDALLDSLYGRFVKAIAEGRGMTEDEARALVDLSPMVPIDAVRAHLVDGDSWRDLTWSKEALEDATRMKDYLAERRIAWARGSAGTVAVVYAEGTIVSGDGNDSLFGGTNMIADRALVKLLEEVREDDDVKAVVLRVNSPGGSGGASDTIWREIQILKESKPVVASMGDYAASGGYYIAMGANEIVAQPTTLTGSIGVFGGKLNLGGLYDKIGVTSTTYERGQSADIFSSIHDFDEVDRVKFRAYLQNFYQTFLTRATTDRPLSYQELEVVAQGRVWTGDQALERKLVDRIGGLDVAIARAAELGHLSEGTYAIERLPERKSFFEELLHDLEHPPNEDVSLLAPEVMLTPETRAAVASLRMLERVLENGHVAAMLPFQITVQ